MQEDFVNEFIGREIEIVDSRDEKIRGMKFHVIDETKKTLTVTQGHRKIMLIKRKISFRLAGGSTVINGRAVEFRPEDRLKEVRKIKKMIGE